MATIDATIGGANSNSYVTHAYASSFWADSIYSANWDGYTADDQNKLLIMATRTLDDWYDWKGSKATDTQALRWPRYGVDDQDGYWIDSDALPVNLKDATVELAGYLANVNPSAEPDTKGFRRIKVDVLELEIDKADRDSTTAIPDSVMKMLDHLGAVKSRGGDASVKLVRT